MSAKYLGMDTDGIACLTMAGKCRVKIRNDAPTANDALLTLEPVTEAIASLIEDSEQKGGRAILLDGPWGSGKSSIVWKLQKRYAESNDTAILVFDAWGHQGDPLRRSFAEFLIQQLKKVGWAKPDSWKKESDKLSGGLEQIESKIRTKLTRTVSAAAIGALFVPVGAVLLAQGLRGSQSLACTIVMLISAFLMVLAPLLLGRLGLKYDRREWEKCKEGPRPTLFTFFSHRRNEDVSTTSYKTANPTSIEFCDVFGRVMVDTLSGEQNSLRKLVIVIDNLDRVAKEDALALWSTMRSIFGEDCDQRQDWLDRLWLLVPMDRHAVARLWKLEDNNPGVNDGELFLSKTFQARFRVPHPVLSKWESFLRSELVEAIPCCTQDDEEAKTVANLFDLLTPGAPFEVTPRCVIQFVNRLAALHVVWRREIPLRTQAAYILVENEIRETPGILVEGNALGSAPKALLNKESCDSDFARMYYGIADRELVAQVLLHKPITSALVQCDADRLDKMKGHEWFNIVTVSAIGRNVAMWADSDAAKLTNAARAVAHLDPEREPAYSNAWKSFGSVVPRKWLQFGEPEGRGLVTILERCTGDIKDLVADLLSSFCGNAALNIATGAPDEVRSWLSGALQVIRYLDTTEHGELLATQLTTPSDVPFYVNVMACLLHEKDCRLLAPYFTPNCTRKEVIDLLTRLAKQEQDELKDEHRDAVQVMCVAAKQWEWGPLVAAVQDRIRKISGNVGAEEVDACISILAFIGHSDNPASRKAQASVDQLVKAGYIERCLSKLSSDNKRHEGVARCAFALFEHYPNTGTDTGNARAGFTEYRSLCSNPDKHQQVAKHFFFTVWEWMPLGRFLKQAMKAKAEPLARFTLDRMLDDPNKNRSYFKPDEVLASIKELQEVYGAATAEFIKRLPTIDSVIDKVASESFEAKQAGLYLLMLEACKDDAPERFASFLSQGLTDLESSIWRDELVKPTELCELVSKARECSIRPKQTTSLLNALLEWAKDTASSSSASKPPEAWKTLISILTDSESAELAKKALDSALGPQAAPRGRTTLLQVLEPHLRESTNMVDRVLDLYCINLASAALMELSWLAGVLGGSISPSRAKVESLKARIADVENDRPAFLRLPTHTQIRELKNSVDTWLRRQESKA